MINKYVLSCLSIAILSLSVVTVLDASTSSSTKMNTADLVRYAEKYVFDFERSSCVLALTEAKVELRSSLKIKRAVSENFIEALRKDDLLHADQVDQLIASPIKIANEARLHL